MNSGRPPARSPRTVFDVHRYLTLVQVLAEYTLETELRTALLQLVSDWQVPLHDDAPIAWAQTLPIRILINLLASYIVSYHISPELEPLK